jgi:membrane protein YdbS with pleckstrin-like domain
MAICWHGARVILRAPAHSLDPRVQTYWLIEGLLVAGVLAALAIAGTVVSALVDATTVAWLISVLGGLVVAGAAVLAVVVPRLDFRHYRYEVTELGLYLAKGWLWRHHQVVPHARVQTVETTVGPLMRAFGLVSVDITTASSSGGLTIPGLAPDVADRLVQELALRAGIEEGT